MKKYLCLFVLVIAIFTFASCQEKKDTAEYADKLNVTSDVAVSIKENSIKNDGFVLIITNNTEKELAYDSRYIIEVKKGDSWRQINKKQVFSADVNVLAADDIVEFNVVLESYAGKSGDYRIVKPVVTHDGVNYISFEYSL